MQFFVQGAWGIIPVHLNELSPGNVRGTFPGFTYQLGNLLASPIAQLEAYYAATYAVGDVANYARSLSTIIAIVFVLVIVMTLVGRERRGIEFTNAPT